ncbi:hypothetical protein Tco_0265153 [Tanacetum coccineum]
MKDKMVYKGDNVVGALMNVPIFVGTCSFVTDFAVLEDMDAYRDEGMGDVIIGKLFLRDVGIKARKVWKSVRYGVSKDWIRHIDLYSRVVFGECRHRYTVSSLMDTAYWSSE